MYIIYALICWPQTYYGDANLWWVFAMRNPNVLKDPLFDFTTGNTIYVPTKASLQSDLGL